MEKRLVIAIDGPVGAGKGTLAVALAKRLNAFYIYTGGMYRGLAFACLQNNVDIHDETKVIELLKKTSIDLQVKAYGTVVILNNKEIFDEMFLPQVTDATPVIAAFPSVRREMVRRQKALLIDKKVIVEGRDIATVVASDADLKIYITADINVRTKRRIKQLEKRGIKSTFEEVLKSIGKRDRQDMERKASPLTKAPDAYMIDTTNLTVEETVDRVMGKLKEKNLI